MNNEEYYRERARRRKARKRKQKIARIIKTVMLALLIVALIVCVVLAVKSFTKDEETAEAESFAEYIEESDESGYVVSSEETQETTGYTSADKEAVVSQAKALATQYDYDGALELLNAYSDPNDADILALKSEIQTTKDSCYTVDVSTVPHIFFHSLLNDTRGFDADLVGESKAMGNGCWMCTADEFRAVLQQMYDAGMVLIRLRDIAVETVNEDGTVTYSSNTNLRLPEGKKPVIMSEDDLSYYHSYDGQGYATKLVLDENGVVKCEYTDAQGNTMIGDYDCVPILESFCQEHPDFSYKGARLIVAMTGYNGCFGYRTDVAYKTGERLTEDQSTWLAEHPDFNWDEDVAAAKEIAEAMKAEGFEFASHTWGHLRAGTVDLTTLMEDNDRFVNTVVPIVGEVDTIIFAHGEDIGDWHDYAADNEKFNYYKSMGYNFYCNVDGSTPSWIQLRSNYVRTGRVDIDGYRLYQEMIGDEHSVADMNAIGVHDIDTFFCQDRITPVELTG